MQAINFKSTKAPKQRMAKLWTVKQDITSATTKATEAAVRVITETADQAE